MRGGFRIRKKYLKQAGWQVVGDSKAGEDYHQSLDQNSCLQASGARATGKARVLGQHQLFTIL
jgi:hypothetical protein